MANYILYLCIGGGAGFLVGVALLAVARAADRKNYIIQRATPMPLSYVNVRDDVWLRGTAECDRPLTSPHFGLSCLHYTYKLQRRVRRAGSTRKGTDPHDTWETLEQDSRSAVFRLRDGEETIEIDGGQADFQDLEKKIEQKGDRRQVVTYLPYPVELSAVGTISEKKERLEPYANIPLIVTPKTREDFVRSAEQTEAAARSVGFLFLWAGVGAASYGLFDHYSWPVPTDGAFATRTLAAAAGAATAVFVPIWALYIYNTFVTYSVRVGNAWRQIDVDLKMRYDLIPNLVDAVKGYLQHEKGLLESIVAIRSEANSGGREEKIAAEVRAAGAVADLGAVIESYPDLKSQPVVAKLEREMKAIEEKIAHGRTIYNETVREYNDNVMSFPRVMLARLCGFKPHRFFEAESD